MWATDCSGYDVVFVFGMPHVMERLRLKLHAELRPGAAVISNGFLFEGWEPEESRGGVYLYRIGSK